MKTITVLLAAGILLMSNISFPQSQDFMQEIKFGAVIIPGFQYNIGNSEFITSVDSSKPDLNSAFGYAPSAHQFEVSKNTFYIERAYLTMNASIAPEVKGRITTDVFPITDGTGKTQYQIGLKFLWLDWTPLKKSTGMSLGFVIGIIPDQWIPINDKYFGYRMFAKTFSDFQWTTSAVRSTNTSNGVYSITRQTNSFFSPADLGANITFNFPNSLGEVYLNVFNGNGFRNLNFDNRFKDFNVIALLHPLASEIKKKKYVTNHKGIGDLTVGGYAYLGKQGLGENYAVNGIQYKRNRFGAMFSLKYLFNKSGYIKVGGEFGIQKNQQPVTAAFPNTNYTSDGYSVYGEFNPPVASLNEKLFLILRYDHFDPDDTDNGNSTSGFHSGTDKQSFILAGAAYKPAKELTFGFSFQQTGYQLPFVVKYDGIQTDKDTKFYMSALLEF